MRVLLCKQRVLPTHTHIITQTADTGITMSDVRVQSQSVKVKESVGVGYISGLEGRL